MLAAKLGVVTGRHLAQHIRDEYPRGARTVLWLLAEAGVIACDMIEVIGGAVALNTLSVGAIPLWAGVLITVTTAFGTLLLERAGMRLLEAALLILVGTMGGTFFYMFFSTDVDYLETLKGALGVFNSTGEEEEECVCGWRSIGLGVIWSVTHLHVCRSNDRQ